MVRRTRADLHHLHRKVEDHLGHAREIFEVQLLDSERYLALVWPDRDGSRLLTPADRPRTLGDVAKRILLNDWTFELLSEDMGRPVEEHDPVRFTKARYIDGNFDYDRFDTLILAPLTAEEKAQSPEGNFYIYDGKHRALVLAKRLAADEETYKKVPALLMIPRPA